MTRHEIDRTCPICGQEMRLEKRGDTGVALYCAGPNGYDGCIWADGEDAAAARAEMDRLTPLRQSYLLQHRQF